MYRYSALKLVVHFNYHSHTIFVQKNAQVGVIKSLITDETYFFFLSKFKVDINLITFKLCYKY